MRVSLSGGGSHPPSPAMAFFFSRIFPLPFALIGAIVLLFGMRHFGHARASLDWPVADAVITASEVVRSRSSNDSGPTYRPEVSYDYSVDGASLSGDRISFGGAVSSSNQSWARSVVARYPVGGQVQVRYHPDDPSLVVLEPGMNWAVWLLPGFGALFLLVGVAMLIFLPRMMRPAAGPPEQVASDHVDNAAPDQGFVDEDNPFRDR